MISNLPQNPARISYCDYICRYISRHYTPGSNNRIISDRYSRKYHCPCSNPASSAYMYRHVELIQLFSQLGKNRVSGCGNSNIGAKHRVISHINMGIVYHYLNGTAVQCNILLPPLPAFLLTKPLFSCLLWGVSYYSHKDGPASLSGLLRFPDLPEDKVLPCAFSLSCCSSDSS